MKRLLLLTLTLLLSSCFDVREEVTVAADGSGRLVFDYSVPPTALRAVRGKEGIREEIDKLIASEPRVRLETLEIIDDGTDARIHIEIVADTMLALMDLKQTEAFQDLPASSRNLAGTIDVRLDGLKVQTHREINVANALGLATLAIGREEREQRQFEYIIHLPKAAENHNADLVEDNGRTLIWKRTLGQALDEPIHQRYTAPIPLPAWVIPAVVIVAMLIVLGIVSLVRSIRRKMSAQMEASS
ncbi:hypothetical protein [Haloferula sp. A504]|uniref:hypothetical protein n=1 Tax=Haloferula sp. A504 TaxID=3373601 RepID=UPI0031C0F37A|nr:hypothetical protein [Verrucomicrobiaceae bacterium E54]